MQICKEREEDMLDLLKSDECLENATQTELQSDRYYGF